MKKLWMAILMIVVLLGATACNAETDSVEDSVPDESISEVETSEPDSISEEEIEEVPESTAPSVVAQQPAPSQGTTYVPGGYPIAESNEIIPHPNGVPPVDGQTTVYNGVEYVYYSLDGCWLINHLGADPQYFDNE